MSLLKVKAELTNVLQGVQETVARSLLSEFSPKETVARSFPLKKTSVHQLSVLSEFQCLPHKGWNKT